MTESSLTPDLSFSRGGVITGKVLQFCHINLLTATSFHEVCITNMSYRHSSGYNHSNRPCFRYFIKTAILRNVTWRSVPHDYQPLDECTASIFTTKANITVLRDSGGNPPVYTASHPGIWHYLAQIKTRLVTFDSSDIWRSVPAATVRALVGIQLCVTNTVVVPRQTMYPYSRHSVSVGVQAPTALSPVLSGGYLVGRRVGLDALAKEEIWHSCSFQHRHKFFCRSSSSSAIIPI
jgi:hypothetical protein